MNSRYISPCQIKLLKSFLIVSALFLVCSFSLHAQNNQNASSATGRISGKIIDSLSSQPIEYATISLLSQSTNKIVNGVTTDSNGVFKITKVTEGTYKIGIDFIGYKKYTKKNVVVSNKNQNIALGTIKLVGSNVALEEVTVIAERPIVENKIDKMVYNVANDVSSQSGVATDVLKKIPQVSVDVNGNVELQGNTDIRFLIDGKPSTLYGSNISEVLQSIPASQIDKIDVITSPGAKYDAEGTGGIINIILKKTEVHGVNGNVSLSAGTRLENGSLNLSMRKGNFGVNAFFSGNAQLLSTTQNTSNKTLRDTTSKIKQTKQTLQNGPSDFQRQGCQSGIGFDWDINPRNNLNVTLGFNYTGNSSNGNNKRISNLFDSSKTLLSDTTDRIKSTSTFRQSTVNLNVGYKKKFAKEDQLFEVLCNTSYGSFYSGYTTNDSLYTSSNATNPGTQYETNIEINYTHPLTETITIETGTKGVFDFINSTSNVYTQNLPNQDFVFNSLQSNSFTYNRSIYAAYLSASIKLFHIIDLKVGLRDEYTTATATSMNVGAVNIKPYNKRLPSGVISHTFKKKQTLKLSYSQRMQRPSYSNLNPFINKSDPQNWSGGNPNLKPELGNKLELGYNQSFKNGSNFGPGVFYRWNRQDIQNIDSVYSSGLSVIKPQNIVWEHNIGCMLYGSVPLDSKITMRGNVFGFERYISDMPPGENNHGFNYRANVSGSYQLNSSFVMELMGNYYSKRTTAQGTAAGFFNYNFALRKLLFNKKGSFALTATNFFNKYVHQTSETYGQDFTMVSTRELPFRSFGFNFTYKFGKMEFKKQREMDDSNINIPQEN